jgi:transcriptional regulator GlxA family with amidase domain
MKVAIVIFDGVQSLDVAGPLDVFAEANTFLSEQQKYEVSLVGARAGTVTCSNGMGLSVPFGLCGSRHAMGPATGRRRAAIARRSTVT